MNARTGIPDEGEFARYVMEDRLEIVAVLRRLIEARTLLSVDWGTGTGDGGGEGGDAGLTTVLAVDPQRAELILDCLANQQANRRICDAGAAQLAGVVDGVRLQCALEGVEEVPFHGGPALGARIPARLLRLQRRESFRVPASIECEIVVDDGGSVRVLELRTANLSVGGMALVADAAAFDAAPGQVIENCHVALGKDDAISAKVEVTSVVATESRGGVNRLRIGCRFVGLPGPMESLLARHIAQFERDRMRVR